MMTVHVLHAGDGYKYLTNQVASGDVKREPGQDLADYYTAEGNPPGLWAGSGIEGLGVDGMVSEDQMVALFGEGRHPNADAMEASLIAGGATPKQAMAESKLGRAFPQFKAVENPFPDAVKAAYDQFRAEQGRSPEVGVERDLIRYDVAKKLLIEGGTPDPQDKQVYRYLAKGGAEQRHAVAGFDLVFTPVKSVSTLWGLADDDVRRQVEQAHEAAWRGSLAWLEKDAAFTRTGTGGAAQVETRGLIGAAFDHMDSRAGDPNLHTHLAISNKVQTVDGKWLALDGRVIHAMGVAASERYNTLIEAELTSRLGVRFAPETRARGKEPVREIVGVDAGVRAELSQRRAEIEAAYDKLVAEYRAKHGKEPSRSVQHDLADQVTLETREGKESGVSLRTRQAQWADRAARVLGGPGEVRAMVHRALHPEPVEPVAIEGDPVDVVLERLAERRSQWTVGHVRAEALRVATIAAAAMGVSNPDTIVGAADELTDRVLAASVALTPADENPVPVELQRTDGESVYRVHGSRRFTSKAVIDAEARLLDAARTEAGPRISPEAVELAIAQTEDELTARSGRQVDLNEGQRALAHWFTAGGRQVAIGIGPAGAGKTTAMQAFVRATALGGCRVLPLAPSAAAAGVLGEELGVRSDTLAKFLHEHQVAGPQGPADEDLRIDAGTVILVDEAGMASTSDLDKVLTLAKKHGASVRLLGDGAQLQAIGAGAVLRLIETKVGGIFLEDVHRFRLPDGSLNQAEADASLAIRDGDKAGLDYYIDAGRTKAGVRGDMLDDVYAAWRADRHAGMSSVMIAATGVDVQALNERARLDRQVDGEVEHGGIRLHDGTRAGTGDKVVTRENDRRLWFGWGGTDFVKNGDTWTVLKRYDDGRMKVRHENAARTLILPADYVKEHVELAYASTIHRVQGMTVDTAHYLMGTGATREQLYTATTRGRYSNRIYAVTGELLDVDAHHGPDPATDLRTALEGVVARSEADGSATATADREADRAASLARLVPEYEDAIARVVDPDRDERLSSIVRAAIPEVAETVLEDDAWPALRERLALHEATGADPARTLAKATRGKTLAGAHSIAQVLHHRLGVPARTDGRDLPDWISPLPADLHHVETVTPKTPAVVVDAPAPVVEQAAKTPTAEAVAPVSTPAPVDVEEVEIAAAARTRVLAANGAAWDFWRERSRDPEDWTRQYLGSRCLAGAVAGRAPDAWDALTKHMRAHGFNDADLIEAGLAKVNERGRVYDVFRDRLVLPVYDGDDVVAFTARANPIETRKDVPKYINSPATPAYDKSQALYGLTARARELLAAGARPVLVEGAADVEAIRTLGDDIVPLAPCGTAVTEGQLDLIRAACPDGLDRLVTALDGDEAGRKAARRTWTLLTGEEAAVVHNADLPDGLDPAQLVQDGRAQELRNALTAGGTPLTFAVVDHTIDTAPLGTKTLEGSLAAVRAVVAETRRLPLERVPEIAAHTATRLDKLAAGTVTGEFLDAHLSDEPAFDLDAILAPLHDIEPEPTPDTDTQPVAPEPVATAVRRPLAEGASRVRDWADRHADLIERRLDELVDQALSTQPAWLDNLGDAPEDPDLADEWAGAVRRVVAYRDRYEHTDPAVAVPTTKSHGVQEAARLDAEGAYDRMCARAGRRPTTRSLAQRAAAIRDRAHAIAGTPNRPTADEWKTTLAEAIGAERATQVLASPTWPLLRDRLTTAQHGGVDVADVLRRGVATPGRGPLTSVLLERVTEAARLREDEERRQRADEHTSPQRGHHL